MKPIERYLEFEREDIKPDDALFSRYKTGGDHLTTMAIQHSYREINKFLNWEPNEDGFNKATNHMLRKFFKPN